MSSIEKAIDRLEGRKPAADPDATAEGDAAERDGPAQSPPASAEAAVDAADDAGVPAGVRTAAAETASAPARRDPPPEPGVRQESNQVTIDFERLEAAGNLTPVGARTQQAEEYQHIKRRLLGNVILNSGSGQLPRNLIMITSSVPGEGKTFTSINLAMSLAVELDHTILVVDTDLMKRDLSRQLGLATQRGLYDYLSGDVENLSDVMYRTNRENLTIIPAGTYTETSTELVASKRMQDLMEEFATRYSDRIVLFDTPPLLATSTAVALAPRVGQIVLVVEAGETRTSTVGEALHVIEPSEVTGVILNKSKAARDGAYYYYGSYYYGGGRKPAED